MAPVEQDPDEERLADLGEEDAEGEDFDDEFDDDEDMDEDEEPEEEEA